MKKHCGEACQELLKARSDVHLNKYIIKLIISEHPEIIEIIRRENDRLRELIRKNKGKV